MPASFPHPTSAIALPVGATTLAVLRLLWVNRGQAAVYGAVPFAIMAALDIAGTAAGINVLNEQWWMIVAAVAGLVVFAPLTVSWFRMLVRGTQTTRHRNDSAARPLFALGAAEWHVIRLNIVLSFVLLGVLAAGAGIALTVMTAAAAFGETVRIGALALVVPPTVFMGMMIFTRLTFAIAHAALGRDIDLRTAWAITSGFGVRFTILHIAVFAIATAIAQVVYLAQDEIGALAGIADESQAGAWTVFLSVTATLFSTLYLLMMSTLYAVVVNKVDAGELGTGMGLLISGNRAVTRKNMAAALAYLAQVRSSGSKESVADFRRLIDNFGSHFPLPAGTGVTRVECGGVPAAWVDVAGAAADRVVLYMHGGGFMSGSSLSHARAAADIGAAARCRMLVVDYRRAPEHPFPAAVEDCAAAYAWLLGRGFEPEMIAFAGDSAGGGLVVSTMLMAQERKLRLPASGVCLSPWVDMDCASPTYRLKKSVDPIGTFESLSAAAKTYLGDAAPSAPLASPIFARLDGLPPLLIQVGSREVLLGDAIALARVARAAGVDVTFEQWPGMIHNWHMLADLIEDGRYANLRIGEFLQSAWAS